MNFELKEVGWIVTVNDKVAFGGWVFKKQKGEPEFKNLIEHLDHYGMTPDDLYEISIRWKEFADKKNSVPQEVINELNDFDD